MHTNGIQCNQLFDNIYNIEIDGLKLLKKNTGRRRCESLRKESQPAMTE